MRRPPHYVTSLRGLTSNQGVMVSRLTPGAGPDRPPGRGGLCPRRSRYQRFGEAESYVKWHGSCRDITTPTAPLRGLG
jgi:hypothetical protein